MHTISGLGGIKKSTGCSSVRDNTSYNAAAQGDLWCCGSSWLPDFEGVLLFPAFAAAVRTHIVLLHGCSEVKVLLLPPVNLPPTTGCKEPPNTPPEGVPGPFTLGGHAETLPRPGGEQCSPGKATELGSDPRPGIHEHPTTGSAQFLIHSLQQQSLCYLAGPTHSSGPAALVPSSTRTPWGKDGEVPFSLDHWQARAPLMGSQPGCKEIWHQGLERRWRLQPHLTLVSWTGKEPLHTCYMVLHSLSWRNEDKKSRKRHVQTNLLQTMRRWLPRTRFNLE